jgi:hypothetical protein
VASDIEHALGALSEHLLSRRPPPLGPDQGAEAFQQHKLLATTVHQATLLDARAHESQTGAWIRYFAKCFPHPRNGKGDAGVLWTDWRTSLLKNGAPGPRVLVSHGQPALHWHRDGDRLCVDLESMWNDFASSVERFLAFLRTDDERRPIVLDRAQRSAVEIVFVSTTSAPASGSPGPVTGATASASVATAFVQIPPKPPGG